MYIRANNNKSNINNCMESFADLLHDPVVDI